MDKNTKSAKIGKEKTKSDYGTDLFKPCKNLTEVAPICDKCEHLSKSLGEMHDEKEVISWWVCKAPNRDPKYIRWLWECPLNKWNRRM